MKIRNYLIIGYFSFIIVFLISMFNISKAATYVPHHKSSSANYYISCINDLYSQHQYLNFSY